MKITVAIASLARPVTLAKAVRRLEQQSRLPDRLILSVTSAEDVVGVEFETLNGHILLSEKGLCIQRNAVMEVASRDTDILVFFDDDFVPANDYLLELEKTFLSRPEVVGITGALVDDGIHGDPIEFKEAVHRLDVLGERRACGEKPRRSLYGCNMAFRMNSAEGMRFDEALPAYGWQEDVDFTFRLGQKGTMIAGAQFTGIHLGTRGARQSGKKLGYSQIANVVYLLRKQAMPQWLGSRLVFQNFAANLVRSVWPEPGIDRRGRLWGNLLALADLARGRIDPRRITQF